MACSTVSRVNLTTGFLDNRDEIKLIKKQTLIAWQRLPCYGSILIIKFSGNKRISQGQRHTSEVLRNRATPHLPCFSFTNQPGGRNQISRKINKGQFFQLKTNIKSPSTARYHNQQAIWFQASDLRARGFVRFLNPCQKTS